MPKVYAIDGVVPVVDPTAFVHPSAVLIGDVVVGPDCYVGPGASLRGDMGRILMKRGANFQDNCIGHTFADGELIMEEGANIGHGAVLHGCHVGQYALIGMNAVLMDGAEVGDYAFVAALAFVRAGFKIPPRTVAGGIPARILRELKDDEIKWKREADDDYRGIVRRSFASLDLVEALTEPEIDGPRITAGGVAPLYITRVRAQRATQG
jgi:phenylacetic acid degradation protein